MMSKQHLANSHKRGIACTASQRGKVRADKLRDIKLGMMIRIFGDDHRLRLWEAVSADIDTNQPTSQSTDTDQEVLLIQANGFFAACFCFKY